MHFMPFVLAILYNLTQYFVKLPLDRSYDTGQVSSIQVLLDRFISKIYSKR